MTEEVNRRATTTQQQPSSDPQSHTAPRRRPAEAHRGGEADPQPRYEQRTQAVSQLLMNMQVKVCTAHYLHLLTGTRSSHCAVSENPIYHKPRGQTLNTDLLMGQTEPRNPSLLQ